MSGFAPTIATNYRLLNVTGLTTLESLDKLVETALALKSAPADALPEETLVEIALTPAADILVGDPLTTDTMTVSTRTVFPVSSLTKIAIKNAVVVSVEMYFV
jgi:hypothetical protein